MKEGQIASIIKSILLFFYQQTVLEQIREKIDIVVIQKIINFVFSTFSL
jgi:hypothetical protein